MLLRGLFHNTILEKIGSMNNSYNSFTLAGFKALLHVCACDGMTPAPSPLWQVRMSALKRLYGLVLHWLSCDQRAAAEALMSNKHLSTFLNLPKLIINLNATFEIRALQVLLHGFPQMLLN